MRMSAIDSTTAERSTQSHYTATTSRAKSGTTTSLASRTSHRSRVEMSASPTASSSNVETTETMTRKHTAYLLPILLVCLTLLSACDRDDLHDDHHAHGIERIVVQGVETDVLYGLWREGGTGWTSGGSLSIDAGSDLSVRVAFFDDHDHEITLRDGGEYSLDIRSEERRVGKEGVNEERADETKHQV